MKQNKRIKELFIPKYLNNETNIILIRIYLIGTIIILLQIKILIELKCLKDKVILW